MKFKEGDLVRCIESKKEDSDSHDGPEGRGFGWEKGLVFKITYTTNTIYWGGKNTHGVFEENLEVVNEIDTMIDEVFYPMT